MKKYCTTEEISKEFNNLTKDLDNNMKSEYEEGYNRDNELSILNRETGYWYKEQLDHFNKVVYPNYIENGTVENSKRFFEI